jgi:hypothetical protein
MTSSWERIGGWSGILFFIVVVASFFTPDTPDADDPTSEIVSSIADDRSGHILSAYLGGVATVLFLIFVGAVWSRLRRGELERGPSVLTLLGGVATGVIILVSDGVLLALVEAADEGREPAAVRALFELDEILFIGVGFTQAVFYAGAAMAGLRTGGIPRWLAWVAAALAVVFVVTLLGVFSEDEDGGVLGGIFFIALLVNFLWIFAAGIGLLRPGEPAATEPRAAAATGGPPPSV